MKQFETRRRHLLDQRIALQRNRAARDLMHVRTHLAELLNKVLTQSLRLHPPPNDSTNSAFFMHQLVADVESSDAAPQLPITSPHHHQLLTVAAERVPYYEQDLPSDNMIITFNSVTICFHSKLHTALTAPHLLAAR